MQNFQGQYFFMFIRFRTVFSNFVRKILFNGYQIKVPPPLLHPVSVPRWRPLNSPGKMLNFQTFFGVRPMRKFSTRETTKPTRDETKIQRGELTNILHWLKYIDTWLIQKHRNDWVTFKCQKILWNITLTIK